MAVADHLGAEIDLTLHLEALQLTSLSLDNLPDDLLKCIIALSFPQIQLNTLRLVNKRLRQVAEAMATRLTADEDGGFDALPLAAMKRCSHISYVRCDSMFIRTLEGCPSNLQCLIINDGEMIQSIEPLKFCPGLERLTIREARRLTDLSPLRSCKQMRSILISFSPIAGISPVASMPLLEELNVNNCLNVKSLSHLSELSKLKKVDIRLIDAGASVLPLASCPSLKELLCDWDAADLRELRKKRPDIEITRSVY